MRIREKEIQRLKSVNSFVKANFPKFGVNKKQEITRLLYEISKREGTPLENIVSLRPRRRQAKNDYNAVKNHLLKRRYPYAFSCSEIVRPYLPKIELKLSEQFNAGKSGFYGMGKYKTLSQPLKLHKEVLNLPTKLADEVSCPKKIFVEKKAAGEFLASRFKMMFPNARFNEIESLKNYFCEHRGFQIKDYNNRRNTVFIVKQKYDFFKICPCTNKALGCGYQVLNLGFGCIFDCNYCFLQGYVNSPGIILPANIDSFFEKFSCYKKAGMRMGSGEFSDSLALDEITQYSIHIIEFFRKQENVTFEFKTKSVNIKNILEARHSGNIVVSWSLNPQSVIDENEFLTPALKQRLQAALKCVEAGYRVGFHFDPVIYSDGWEKEYALLVENLFTKINPKHIAWISIGTFRFSPGLKQVIEKRFPENSILNEELLLGFDNKLRYPYQLRLAIYKKMIVLLSKHSSKLNLYLCMEDISMWNALKLTMPEFTA